MSEPDKLMDFFKSSVDSSELGGFGDFIASKKNSDVPHVCPVLLSKELHEIKRQIFVNKFLKNVPWEDFLTEMHAFYKMCKGNTVYYKPFEKFIIAHFNYYEPNFWVDKLIEWIEYYKIGFHAITKEDWKAIDRIYKAS